MWGLGLSHESSVQAAISLVETFGDQAKKQALVQVKKMTKRGDQRGLMVWLEIVEAIDANQKNETTRRDPSRTR